MMRERIAGAGIVKEQMEEVQMHVQQVNCTVEIVT